MTSKTARPFLAIAGFALVACGGGPSGEAPEANASPTVTPAPAPSAIAPTPAPSAAAIPARFIGVWDAETGTCNRASDLRLEIAPQSFDFYESRGTVTAVTESRDGSVVIGLAMEGEGDNWDQTIKLALIRSGDTEWLLSLPGPDSDVMVRPIRLKRCPA